MDFLNLQADQQANQEIGAGLPISGTNPSPVNLNLHDYDISLELVRGSRNAMKKQINTELLPTATKIAALAVEEDGSNLSQIRGIDAAQISASFKNKVMGSKWNQAQTAAQSQSLEGTLARDPSRQYLDVNFSIAETDSVATRQQAKPHDTSQVLKYNQAPLS